MLPSLFRKRKQPGWLALAATDAELQFVHCLGPELERPVFGLCGTRKISAANRLDELAKQLHFETFTCTTVLPRGEYQLLLVEGLNVPQDELKSAVRWRIKDMLDYHVDDATIDVLSIPIDEAEQRVKGRSMFAVTARNEVIQGCVRRFEDAHIPLEVIDVLETAQRNIAARLEHKGRPLALLYLGPDSGLLTINYRSDLVQARRLDAGCDALAQGGAQREETIERIALELQRTWDHFERQFRMTVERLVLAPTPEEYGLAPALSQSVGIPVEPLDVAAIAEPGDSLASPRAQWELFHLIGASLRQESKAL